MEPNEFQNFINRYYEIIFEPVKKHDGVVSNVVGDSMLAMWVTTHLHENSRRDACYAAIDIQRAVTRFNQSSGGLQLPTRIGLHSGNFLLSSIGAIDHYEYRPVGDIVNTATRIEGLNKFLGTWVLVSDEVLEEIEGFLDRYRRGRSHPVSRLYSRWLDNGWGRQSYGRRIGSKCRHRAVGTDLRCSVQCRCQFGGES